MGEEIPEEFGDLTIPQLREKIEAFQYRLNKSAKERNYMQLEKDMVNRFYQITKDEVKQISAKLLNKDRLMEMMERDHRVHIKVHEQQLAKNEEVRMFKDTFARNLQKLREDFETNH